MKQCLKIIFSLQKKDNVLQNFVQKNARSLNLEGTVYMVSAHSVEVLICGPKEAMEEFVDLIYKGTSKIKPQEIEVEPFIKDRDFRGVFRVIE